MIAVIIGGSGFLGQQVIPKLLEDPQVERIRVMSRSEHIQADLKEKFKDVDFFIGDVRDAHRVKRALKGATNVFHFAANKRVEQAEYDPSEAIETNVRGTQNVIDACQESETIEKAIFTSTDKAVEPINVYGLSKALAEKLWIQANIGRHRAKFSACRYGNVFGSHGSVIEKWRIQAQRGEALSVIDSGMTRFFMSPEASAEFVLSSMRMMNGGEVFIPKMKSTEMVRLAQMFNAEMKFISRRPGEKVHEKLEAEAEEGLITDIGDRYVRWPEYNLFPVQKRGDVAEVKSSKDAERFTDEELKCLIK